MSKETLVCQNCGATIEKLDAECPFCGHINLPGAEHKFMKGMYQKEEELENIPELQVDNIKKEVKRSTKFVAIIVSVLVGIILLIVGASFLLKPRYPEEDPKQRMLWEQENFPKLDAWYEAGEYDKILEFQNELYDSGHVDYIFDWEHLDFLNAYDEYVSLLYYEDILNTQGKVGEFEATYMMHYAMELYYRTYDRSFFSYTAEELEMIDTIFRVKAEELLFERMKFTSEELDELYQSAYNEEYDYIEVKACEKYAKKIYTRVE